MAAPIGALIRKIQPQDACWLRYPPVSGPIAGRLLLAPRRAATLALTVPGGSGWVPCEKLTAAYLYVPSATGWDVTATGYALAEGTDLGELEAVLLAAMSTSATVTVGLATVAGPGVMVVNHFLKWIDTARVSQRAAAASALAHTYLTADLGFEDRCAAEAALTFLLDDPSAKVRLALAEALSLSRHAPMQIIAAHRTAGTVDKKRPLCRFPEIAKYKGAGDPNDAASFTCGLP